ncbi:MAG: hypothetical protein IJ877_00485, partial [Candidatus Gastranaerophilales bacterium]|nr:hypothetical protein [Candidatus Gastranaerophilales bacterium]
IPATSYWTWNSSGGWSWKLINGQSGSVTNGVAPTTNGILRALYAHMCTSTTNNGTTTWTCPFGGLGH